MAEREDDLSWMQEVDLTGLDLSPTIGPPEPHWEPVIQEMWLALSRDPISRNIGAFALSTVKVFIEDLDREMKPHYQSVVQMTGEVVEAVTPVSAAKIATLFKMLTDLGATPKARQEIGRDLVFHANGNRRSKSADARQVVASRREAIEAAGVTGNVVRGHFRASGG